jgi:hypothetical protein
MTEGQEMVNRRRIFRILPDRILHGFASQRTFRKTIQTHPDSF